MITLRTIPCVLLLLAACMVPEPAAEPVQASSEAPTWTFNTPALAESHELALELIAAADHALGELVIDGHVTSARLDPNRPPRVDATGDGRYLIYGQAGVTAADWMLFVWEPEPARLTPLGAIGRTSVLPLGAVFVRHADEARVNAIFELSRSEPRLDPIWEADPEPALIIGAHQGGLLLLEGPTTLMLIRSATAPERRELELGDWTPLQDPPLGRFDDGRLLLARPLAVTTDGDDPGTWALAVLDVDAGGIAQIGTAPGSWTPTNVSQPAPPIAFFVDDLGAKLELGSMCTTAVRRSDLALRTQCPDHIM